MTKLDKLKLRLNITDSSQDALLNMFIEDAVDKVRLYLNYRNEESLEAFDGTVIQIATVLYKQFNSSKDVKSESYSEGSVSQSTTYIASAEYDGQIDSLLKGIARYRRLYVKS